MLNFNLRLGVQRKHRFSEQFHEDTTNLVSAITSDVIGIVLKTIEFDFLSNTLPVYNKL